MYRIYIETPINAPQERAFDMSRSIDFHSASMNDSKEIAVAGRMSGLFELGEFVEWEATHLFVRQRLASKCTEMVRPRYFVDEMVHGAFKSFHHRHEIKKIDDNQVVMIDDFRYETPFGIFGKVAYHVFLKRYLEKMLMDRCVAIKNALETDEWKKFLAQ